MADRRAPALVARPRGFNGARLGEPYVYRWIDLEPTDVSWNALAERQGCVVALALLPVFAGLGIASGAWFGLELGLLFWFWTVPIMQAIGFSSTKRSDQEPVPKTVRREAYIEYADDDFYFVVEDNGKARIWQPWSLVRRFEKTAYWPMFGDAGKSPYETGWHAIAMTPDVGKPWMIGSSIEGEAALRERFTALDDRFGEAARQKFMRAYEARKKSAAVASQNEASSVGARARDGVPVKL